MKEDNLDLRLLKITILWKKFSVKCWQKKCSNVRVRACRFEYRGHVTLELRVRACRFEYRGHVTFELRVRACRFEYRGHVTFKLRVPACSEYRLCNVRTASACMHGRVRGHVSFELRVRACKVELRGHVTFELRVRAYNVELEVMQRVSAYMQGRV